MYNEMIQLAKNKQYKSDVLEIDESFNNEACEAGTIINLKSGFQVKPNLEFLLFTSHTPCKY